MSAILAPLNIVLKLWHKATAASGEFSVDSNDLNENKSLCDQYFNTKIMMLILHIVQIAISQSLALHNDSRAHI